MSLDKKDDIIFSDDDDDYKENSELNEKINMRLQEKINPSLNKFKSFLSEPSFIKQKGDNSTNIVDRLKGVSYNIPNGKISKFFRYLDHTRKNNIKQLFNEKQLEYSGIMLDFDIKLSDAKCPHINKTNYKRLSMSILKVIHKYIQPNNTLEEDIYIGFTKKPKRIFDENSNTYKDGIHMLIPGIKITRQFKRFLINKIIDSDIMKNAFRELKLGNNMKYSDILDINSAHVPTFFIGCSSKVSAPPYILDAVYKITLSFNEEIPNDFIPDECKEFFDKKYLDEKQICICHEFSLNWEKSKGGIINKNNYNIKPKYEGELPLKKEEQEIINEDKIHSEMSLLNIHDHNTEEIKSLLDILDSSRSENYKKWFDVLCALANESSDYKILGEYFSKKCPEKFNQISFNNIWNSIASNNDKTITIASINYWAKLDNPDAYKEIKKKSVNKLVFDMVYSKHTEGDLEHYDVAKIIHVLLKNKFAVSQGTWYEFIVDKEPMLEGELYKWREYKYKPNSILRYISEVVPDIFDKVLDGIKNNMDNSDQDLSKYHYTIFKNFQKSCRSLRNSSYKRSVVSECEQLFERMDLFEKMDSNPCLKGVANGILKLGEKCSLITGYHNYYVSKYTKVAYRRMNPYNTTTRKVLIALRNMFPDDEPDTFNYIMHYLASTLDGKKKESIMMLLVGKGSNGKSFLVELHKGAIGAMYGVKLDLEFLKQRSGAEQASPALMKLKDAHFAYYSESNKYERLNMAKIKELTGQETLSGRKLHQDYENFKPRCHHLVASNNDFEIVGTDHGTWRRIDYVTMKIKFCNPATDKYDKNNPYERLADPSLGSNWSEDPEVLSSYLGIMAYYYESLQKNYKGKVRNVPHPNIIKETEAFRNRQDRVNIFITQNMVKCPNSEEDQSLDQIVEYFKAWYDRKYDGADNSHKTHAKDNLENSKIQPYLIRDGKGETYLRGYRVLSRHDEIDVEAGETYARLEDAKNHDTAKLKAESAEEFISRLCKEYDSNTDELEIMPVPAKEVIESDASDEEDEVKEDVKKYKDNVYVSNDGIFVPTEVKKKNNEIQERIRIAKLMGSDSENSDSD